MTRCQNLETPLKRGSIELMNSPMHKKKSNLPNPFIIGSGKEGEQALNVKLGEKRGSRKFQG